MALYLLQNGGNSQLLSIPVYYSLNLGGGGGAFKYLYYFIYLNTIQPTPAKLCASYRLIKCCSYYSCYTCSKFLNHCKVSSRKFLLEGKLTGEEGEGGVE